MFCKMSRPRSVATSSTSQARSCIITLFAIFILATVGQATASAGGIRNVTNGEQKQQPKVVPKPSTNLLATDDIFEAAASNDEPEIDTEADSNDNDVGESSEGPEEPTQSPQQLAAQREREAAEAREADEANRAALSEQQAQQDRIIKAQSQAEARAVIDQRRALSRQQDTLMEGQLRELDEPRMQRGLSSGQLSQQQSPKRSANYHANVRANYQNMQPRQARSQQGIQFGDHDLSFRQQQRKPAASAASVAYQNRDSELEAGASDLIPAAQYHHNYGSHYGSLHKHQHGKYYQFAESHKKGQYKAGFKRGNKKFHISGHSSQHKSHANGHVKWHSKKGKGSHHWDYKHKDKKHHKHHY